jgi:hypothetical protein
MPINLKSVDNIRDTCNELRRSGMCSESCPSQLRPLRPLSDARRHPTAKKCRLGHFQGHFHALGPLAIIFRTRLQKSLSENPEIFGS